MNNDNGKQIVTKGVSKKMQANRKEQMTDSPSLAEDNQKRKKNANDKQIQQKWQQQQNSKDPSRR